MIEAARRFIGTPFVQQGRLPGIGLDCIGLVVCALREAGIPVDDRTNYNALSEKPVLIDELEARMDRIEIDDARPGDVLVFWFRKDSLPQHLAIVTDHGLVHCYYGHGVVEHVMNASWRRRVHSAWKVRWPR